MAASRIVLDLDLSMEWTSRLLDTIASETESLTRNFNLSMGPMPGDGIAALPHPLGSDW